MFYTDTNGLVPQQRQFALVLLESAMETLPLYELNIENFNQLVRDLDLLSSNFDSENEEIRTYEIQIIRPKNRKKAP